MIAFVGPEATGKSTVLRATEKWLSAKHKVRRIHTGKPPSTLLTFVPHFLLPALRAMFPEQRSLRITSQYQEARKTRNPYPLLFGVRSVMLAYERRVLVHRAFAWSAEGTIVLSDRYPSCRSGAPDSPQLGHLPVGTGRAITRRLLTALETRLYRAIPAPHVVIQLTAPLEVTLARNLARDKTEPEDYVRFRHSLTSTYQFDGAIVHQVNTDRPLEAVVREVQEAVELGP